MGYMGRRGVIGARGGPVALGLAAKLGKRVAPIVKRAVGRARAAARSPAARRAGREIAVIGGGGAAATAATRAITRRGEGAPRKKYRRLNPMNFRALSRAVRRIDAAEKMFRKVLRVRNPRASQGSITPKTRRRK